MLESGLLTDAGDRYALAGPLPPLAIPATLQDSLMARLDRLAPVKEVAQIGAVIGREFSHELLAAVVAPGPRRSSRTPCDQLVATPSWCSAGARRRRRATPSSTPWSRTRPTQSLLKSRRRQLHARIARGARGASPRRRRDTARGAGPPPDRGGAAGAGDHLLGEGGPTRRRALRQSGGDRAFHRALELIEALPRARRATGRSCAFGLRSPYR